MKKRILLADDEPPIRSMLKYFIEDADSDIIVVLAENGKEALEKLLIEEFDLVISDLLMPIMDGDKLQSSCEAAGISTPFLFISGYAPEEKMNAVRKRSRLMMKPLNTKEFLGIVMEMLRLSQHLEEPERNCVNF